MLCKILLTMTVLAISDCTELAFNRNENLIDDLFIKFNQKSIQKGIPKRFKREFKLPAHSDIFHWTMFGILGIFIASYIYIGLNICSKQININSVKKKDMKSRKSILDFDLKRNKLLSITSQSAVDVRENNLQISTVTKSVRKESVESLVSIKMTPKNFTKKQLKVDDYRDEKTSIKSNTSINKKEFIETDEKTLKIPGTFEDIKLFKNLPNKRLLSVTIDNDEIISIKSESSFTKKAQENKMGSNESNESSVSSTESVESLKRRNPICLKVKNRDEAISVKTMKTINRNNSTDSNETLDLNMGIVRKYKKPSKVLKEESVSSNDTEESPDSDSSSSAKSESEESNQSVKKCNKATICTLEDSQTNSIKPVNYLFNKKHSKTEKDDEDDDSNATENDQDSIQTVDESNEEEEQEQTNDKSSNESADENTSIESVNTNEYSASKGESEQNDSHEYAEFTKSIEKEYETSPSNSDDSVTESNISENDYEDEEDEKSQSEKEKTSESEDDESEDEDSNEEGEESDDNSESEENEDESSNEEEEEPEDEDESESKEEETEEDDESEEQSDDEDEDMHEEIINYKKVKTRKSITSIKSVKFATKNQIHPIPRLKH